MAEQPGTAHQRLQTSWHAVHQPSCSSSFALQRHIHSGTTRASRAVSSSERWRTSMRRRSLHACCGTPPMAEQPGTARQRLQTSSYTAHQPCWSSSFALQRHLLRYDTGIESRYQLVNGGAHRCAVEGCMLAAVLHRWQSSRAWPGSDSRPAGAQCTTRPARLASRCSRIY